MIFEVETVRKMTARFIPVELHETTTVVHGTTPHFAFDCPTAATFTEADAMEKLKDDFKDYNPMEAEFVPSFEDADNVMIRYESIADMPAPEHASVSELKAMVSGALSAAQIQERRAAIERDLRLKGERELDRLIVGFQVIESFNAMLFKERGITDGRFVLPGRHLYRTGDGQTKPLPPSLSFSIFDNLPTVLDVSMRNVSTRQTPKGFGISESLYGTNASIEALLREDLEPAPLAIYQLLKNEYMKLHPRVQEHNLNPRNFIDGSWTA